MDTIDKVAIATLTLPIMLLVFWPVSRWVYVRKGGTLTFRRRQSGNFVVIGVLSAFQVLGAAIFVAGFLPIPSVAGYIFGGMIVAIGLVAGCCTLIGLAQNLAVISQGMPDPLPLDPGQLRMRRNRRPREK